MDKLRLNINGVELCGVRGQTILEAARENGIEIPTLCYDERVQIYGSCGLCVVEVEGILKLLRACATEISEGMVIRTETEKVRGSRKLALELLLSDHAGDCRPPCVKACPGETDCQGYVGLIANGEYEEALKLIKEQLPLPASIGRICPHPCEKECRRQLIEEPVSIAWLKSFVADIDLKNEASFIPDINKATGKNVAIVGGGPGGLTAAYYLRKHGHSVTIYDAMPKMGGMLRYGIPEYRLPKEVLDKEIGIIERMGVKLINNIKVGKDITLQYIKNCYDAVYVAIGAWKSSKLGCPGEESERVLGGIDFLREVALNKPVSIGSRIAVVGGGNTAMDACRTAVRLGAKEVYVIYRRTEEEMPAEKVEIEEAKEEGVIFKFLVSPIEIRETENALSLRLQKMRLGEPDSRGRRSPVPVHGEEEILEVDNVISAIGQITDANGFDELSLTKKGTIYSDESSFLTNIEGIFAGGDAVNQGAGIAIQAIGHSKKAADVIDSYLNGKIIPYKKPYIVERNDVTAEEFKDREKQYRPSMSHLSPEERKTNFAEIVKGYKEEDALREAARCLECGCHDVFECKLIEYANEYDVKPERLAGEVHKRKQKDDNQNILRNPDKCILCGLCVRVCEEVMGVTALGLVSRGFDTVVKPALEQNLKEAGCISCGQCISVCPTGALLERQSMKKPVPLRTKKTHTVCASCSVGCNVKLDTKGKLIVRALPDKGSKVSNGLLCEKGRFSFGSAYKTNRLIKPMICKNGKLETSTWEDALAYAVKKIQSIISLNGEDSVAVHISDKYTNEEIYLAKIFASKALKTKNISGPNIISKGIRDVLGYDASTNTLDELLSAETIVLIGSDVIKDHLIAGIKIKEAVKRGAKLIVINTTDTMIDEYAYKSYIVKDQLELLKEIEKSIIDKGIRVNEAKVNGFEELKASLKDIIAGENARELCELITGSKRTMFVFDQKNISPAAAEGIANIAVMTEHIGKPRSGIIQLKPNCNSQGLCDIIGGESSTDNESVKAVIAFGEVPYGLNPENLDFLIVQDTHLTALSERADIVLPAVGFAESKGTYTSAERRVQKLEQALEPLTGFENWNVIAMLSKAFGLDMRYESTDEIFNDIKHSIKGYDKVDLNTSGHEFWYIENGIAMYAEKFGFEDGKARLMKE